MLIILGAVSGSMVGGMRSKRVFVANVEQEHYSTKYSNASPVEETTLTLDNANTKAIVGAIYASTFIIILKA